MERPPTPVFWPGEFHGLYSPSGLKESDITEQLSLFNTVPWWFFGFRYQFWKTNKCRHNMPFVHWICKCHSLLGWNRGSDKDWGEERAKPPSPNGVWLHGYNVREVLNHLENPGKARQRTFLCTDRGVAAWLLIWFQRLWITVCPEGPGPFSLRSVPNLV